MFSRAVKADFINVDIPVDSNLDSPYFQPSQGTASFEAGNDSIIWEIKDAEYSRLYQLNAVFKKSNSKNLEKNSENSSKNSDDKPVMNQKDREISVNFKIPFFPLSKIEVLNVSVFEKTNYPVRKYISYLAKSSSYKLH